MSKLCFKHFLDTFDQRCSSRPFGNPDRYSVSGPQKHRTEFLKPLLHRAIFFLQKEKDVASEHDNSCLSQIYQVFEFLTNGFEKGRLEVKCHLKKRQKRDHIF